MRLLCFLSVLISVAPAPVALAQDPFQGVPVEPRPPEYIHWDAQAYAGFKSGLEATLRDRGGIRGTPFVVTQPLPRAPQRPQNVQITHRAGYTPPEIHAT